MSAPVKKTKSNLPGAGPGRPKGSQNKTTALLKDAILKAATDAGGGDMAAYLKARAIDSPGPFLALLGKVLPLQVTGDGDGPLQIAIVKYADDTASS